jgi:hypothetical protein
MTSFVVLTRAAILHYAWNCGNSTGSKPGHEGPPRWTTLNSKGHVLRFLRFGQFFGVVIACALSVPQVSAVERAHRSRCLQATGGGGHGWVAGQQSNESATRIPFKPQHSVGYEFSFNIDTRGVTLPAGFEDQVEGAARAMYGMWRQVLAPQRLLAAHVDVLLLVDRIDFENLKHHVAPDLPEVTGFYSSHDGMAVARYDARDLEQSRRSAIHEVSHLLTSSQIGPTDTWLAEGLAEYFETLAMDGSAGTGTVSVNQRHVHLLNVDNLPVLGEFIRMPGSQWKTSHSIRYYAVAWSLVYFLMDSNEGKAVLGRLLHEVYEHACQPHSTAELLEQAYQGGLQQLDADWRRWLRGQQYLPHELPAQSPTPA